MPIRLLANSPIDGAFMPTSGERDPSAGKYPLGSAPLGASLGSSWGTSVSRPVPGVSLASNRIGTGFTKGGTRSGPSFVSVCPSGSTPRSPSGEDSQATLGFLRGGRAARLRRVVPGLSRDEWCPSR
jgi:hypothetical protein